MYLDFDLFKQFISSNCQRGEFIQDYFNHNGIEAPAINLNGKRHIYVKFPNHQYDKKYPVKTVLAHYDRVENSPGANDNSVVIFLMMDWAVRLSKMKSPHNIRLMFTDGEESGAEGIKSQGAFDLGMLFRRLNIIEDDIFVFDCMGRGSVPVISQANFPSSVSEEFIAKYKSIELKTERLLTSAAGQYVKLPSSYSDNAGFIANGIPAVAITMLPFEEICLYKKGLNLLAENQNINGEDFKNYIPKTWQMFHSKDDCFENLTIESFKVTERILDLLASIK